MKRIVFYIKCLMMVWRDRKSKKCRAKSRRYVKEFQRIYESMGLER